jgi:uncharacterized protein DUF3551
MRPVLMIAIVAAFCASATPANAQSRSWYPWCSVYETFSGENHHCGFVSFEECRRNLSSGLGDVCSENIWEPRPEETYRPQVKRPRKR